MLLYTMWRFAFRLVRSDFATIKTGEGRSSRSRIFFAGAGLDAVQLGISAGGDTPATPVS